MEKNILGPVIKQLRKEKKLTQLELSKLTGIAQNTISNHENQNRTLDERDIQIYANALNVKPQEFYDRALKVRTLDGTPYEFSGTNDLIFKEISDLSDSETEEVMQFINYLKSKR